MHSMHHEIKPHSRLFFVFHAIFFSPIFPKFPFFCVSFFCKIFRGALRGASPRTGGSRVFFGVPFTNGTPKNSGVGGSCPHRIKKIFAHVRDMNLIRVFHGSLCYLSSATISVDFVILVNVVWCILPFVEAL